MTAAELIADLRARGFALAESGGRVRVSPASQLTADDRAGIGERLPGLVEALRRESEWEPADAARLESAADELVGRLGVSGTDEVIAAAAERGVAAHLRHDMAGVRAPVAEVERRARQFHQGQCR